MLRLSRYGSCELDICSSKRFSDYSVPSTEELMSRESMRKLFQKMIAMQLQPVDGQRSDEATNRAPEHFEMILKSKEI